MKNNSSTRVAVIGGGAAGFFAALSAKEHHPNAEVTLFEKTGKLLSKVKVSGGGRCNVTNSETRIGELAKAYPRGGKLLKKAFHEFSTADTIRWFEKRNVKLKTESDGRIFPVSDNSQTIIDCLLKETRKLGVEIRTGTGVQKIEPIKNTFKLHLKNDSAIFDKVIITTGGSPKRSGFDWLQELGHVIVDPAPSLFTFNMPKNPVTQLMGVVCEHASVTVQSSKLKSNGPLLITHWGMSGPAILKLSAFGARLLSERNYQFTVQVNWANGDNNEAVLVELNSILYASPNKQIVNIKPFGLSERLWEFLIERAELPKTKKWSELGKKGFNRLSNLLINDQYQVSGKTTFKEEFVTCGGIDLACIHSDSMESKANSGMYFAGEVLDIDGITGGFNFQAAWTTGFIAGKLA